MSAASEQAVPQTRALVPLGQSQRSMALTRDIVEGILVGMLPYGQIVYKRAKGQKGKDSKKTEVRTDAQRAELIESLIVRHPDNPHVPFLSTVNWSGKPERFGKVVVPVLKDGKPQRNEDGTPKIKLIDQVDLLVSGHSDLPVPGATGDARKTRVTTQVYPLIVCDGAGKMLPYGDTKVQGGSAVFIGVDNMLCFFLYDIDPWTWKRRTDRDGNPIIKAVPCALARHGTVRHWNELVVRRAAQDANYPIDRERVTPMAHNLYGRPALKLTPTGHPSLKGGYTVLRTRRHGRGGGTRDTLVIGRVGGKSVVAWDKNMPLILPPDGEAFKPHKLYINEGWANIRARVDGIWGAGTHVSSHEVGADTDAIDAMEALGITLFDAGPRDVTRIVRDALRAPLNDNNTILAYLVENGHLQPDADNAVVGRHIRGLGAMLQTEAVNAIKQARTDLVHDLGPAGRQNGGMPNITDILGEDHTPEALLKAHKQQRGQCPLAKFIVESSTAERLGLEAWDWGCWVLTQARKDLLKDLAFSQADGLKLPPRRPKTTPAVLAEPLTDVVAEAEQSAGDSGSSDVSSSDAGEVEVAETEAEAEGAEAVADPKSEEPPVEAAEGPTPDADSKASALQSA